MTRRTKFTYLLITVVFAATHSLLFILGIYEGRETAYVLGAEDGYRDAITFMKDRRNQWPTIEELVKELGFAPLQDPDGPLAESVGHGFIRDMVIIEDNRDKTEITVGVIVDPAEPTFNNAQFQAFTQLLREMNKFDHPMAVTARSSVDPSGRSTAGQWTVTMTKSAE